MGRFLDVFQVEIQPETQKTAYFLIVSVSIMAIL